MKTKLVIIQFPSKHVYFASSIRSITEGRGQMEPAQGSLVHQLVLLFKQQSHFVLLSNSLGALSLRQLPALVPREENNVDCT